MKTEQTEQSKAPLLLSMAVVLLAVILFINGAFTFYLLRRDVASLDEGNYQLANLVVMAAQALNQPLAIEPVSGKAYIPTAKLALPPVDNSLGELVYRYDPGNGSHLPAELNLASKNNISRTASAVIIASSAKGSPKMVLDKVPALQACARGVTVSFQPREAGQEAVATKLLSNGKTAYFYTEPNCPNPELLDYAKQIDSY